MAKPELQLNGSTRWEAEDHSYDQRVLQTISAVALGSFACVAALAFHRNKPSGLDRTLLHGYQPHKSSGAFRVAAIVTDLGGPGVVVVFGFACAAWCLFRWRLVPWAVACIIAPGVAGVLESVLKVVIARNRPIAAALTGEFGYGFPSGHTTGFTALAVTLALAVASRRISAKSPRRRAHTTMMLVPALIASMVMALTRVLVGAHYPIDVIGGLFLGTAVALLTTSFIQHRWVTSLLRRVIPPRFYVRTETCAGTQTRIQLKHGAMDTRSGSRARP